MAIRWTGRVGSQLSSHSGAPRRAAWYPRENATSVPPVPRKL